MEASSRGTRSLRNLTIALIAAALAAWAQHLLAQDHLRDGLIVYAIAGLIFAFALRNRGSQPAWDRVFASPTAVQGPAWRRWAALVALALSSAFTILALELFGDQIQLPQAWRFHLLGIALFLLFVYLFSFPIRDLRVTRFASLPVFRLASRSTLLALFLILLLAAFLRLYHLDTIPYGVWYDESDNGLQVRHMIQDPTWRPVFVPSTNLPAHFLYLVLLSFRLFGETPLALRIVAVVMGLLTVLAAYLAGRELWPDDRRLALVLAFFLAVSRWDVNWSRIGMHGVSVPLFELLTLGLLLRALRTGRLTAFAWAGVSLGLGLCFYAPFRLFPMVLAFFLGAWFLDQFSCGQVVTRAGMIVSPVLVFSIAALLTAAPVAQFALLEPDTFWGRAQKMSIQRDPNVTDLPAAVAQNAVKHVLMFNYRGDPNGRHNLPGEPMLDDAVGVLFILGFFVALTRMRRPKYLLLVVWGLLMLAGGVFSVTFESPQSLRAIGTLPAAYALAVVPLELLLTEAEALFRRRQPRRVIQGALVLLLTFVGWANYDTFFNRQARDFAVWNAFATAETHLAREIQRLRDDYDLYFDPLLFRHMTTQFLLPDYAGYRAYDPATVFPVPDPTSGKQGVVLFVAPDSRPTRSLLEHFYPAAQLEEFGHPYGGPAALFTYILPREVIAATHGLIGRYYSASDTLPRFQHTDLTVDFDWARKDPPLPFPLRADWQGSIKVPAYGAYQFAVEAPGAVEMWLDQRPLSLDDHRSSVFQLPAGVHALRLVCRVEEPGSTRLLWRTPRESGWAPVPAAVLYHDPFTGHGLVGRFFANDSWSGPPVLSRMDPTVAYYFHHIPMSRPYTVEWRGRLEIPESGRWGLGTEALSATWVFLDGREILANAQSNQFEQVELDLAAGWYDVTLRFLDAGGHSHVYLFWQPPGGSPELIPTHYLYPPAEGTW